MYPFAYLDAPERAVAVTAVADVTQVVSIAFSVDHEALLELGEVEGGVGWFAADAVGVVSFGDDFTHIFADQLVCVEVGVGAETDALAWGGESGGGRRVVGL